MADSGTGIQELMAAETRASQIVAEARIGRFSNAIDLHHTFATNDGGRKTVSMSLWCLESCFV
jgi:hypothetical protein